MSASPLPVAILSFAIGMILQALFMLRARFLPGDGRKGAIAAGVALLGFMPGKREHDYQLMFHVFLVFLLGGGAFAYLFRERLLTRIGGRLLLAWNLLLVGAVVNSDWPRGWLVPLLIPTLATVVNAFTDIDRAFGWKVFFHAWFSTMLVLLAIRGVDAGPFGMFWVNHGETPETRSVLEMLAGGAAFLYIAVNAWFVLALTPIPFRRGKDNWKDRMTEIHRHMELLAKGYVWEKDDPIRSLAVLLGLPALLILAGRWGSLWIPAVIAMMPLIGGSVVEGEPSAREEAVGVGSMARPPLAGGRRRRGRR